MAGTAAPRPPLADARRLLRRVRLATAATALLFLVPLFALAHAAARTPVSPLSLAAALGLGVPPLVALLHLRGGPAPEGLRMAGGSAAMGLCALVLLLVFLAMAGGLSPWVRSVLVVGSVAVGWVLWRTRRDAIRLHEATAPEVDWRRPWKRTALRLAGYYLVDLMALGCGSLAEMKDSRVANEARAIGDVRTVISAQAAYSSTNGGLYEADLACLATPSRCFPGYPATAPFFLDSGLASLAPKNGYARAFVAGPRPSGGVPPGSSPSSVRTWAYTARPLEYGKTGFRSFFADETGVIRFAREDRPATSRDPPIE